MSGYMFRTRFRQQIVAEVLPPARERKTQKVVILCDAMPSIRRKQPLSEFLAAKGFGSLIRAIAEHGKATEKSPHQDILDVQCLGIEPIVFLLALPDQPHLASMRHDHFVPQLA